MVTNNLDIYIRIMAQGMQNAQAVRGEINKLNSATSNVSKTAATSFNNYFKSLQSLGSRINVQGQRMTMALTLPLVFFAKSSVDTYLSVEESFLRIEKVFSGTVEGLEKIKESAFTLSNKFGKPVEEITEIMTNFNKAGIESVDDLRALADITSQTSIMFDINLATATEGITSLMFGFKFSVEETRQALADINLVADTTTASEAGILEVFTKVAGLGRNVGASVREIAAAQAIFEASAIPAGRAGNALKAIFVSFDKASTVSKKQFKDLGLDMDDVSWKTSSWTEKMDKLKETYDKVKSIGDKKIFEEFIKNVDIATQQSDDFDFSQTNVIDKLKFLRASLVKAQEAGDTDTFNKISGQLNTLNLAGEGPIEKITDLDDKIRILAASGNTTAIADINEALGSFMGKFQISNMAVLLGGWNDFKTILEETKDPAVAMERWAKGMNTYLESDVVKMAQLTEQYKNQKYIIGKELFPIYEKVVGILGKVLEKFNNLSPGMRDFIIKIGIIAVAIGPILVYLGLMISSIGFLGSAITEILGSEMLGGLLITFGLIIAALALLYFAWTENWGGIQEKTKEALGNIKKWFQIHWSEISAIFEGAWKIMKGTFEVAWGILYGIMTVAMDIFKGDWGKIWEDMKVAFNLIWEGLKTIVSGAIEAMKNSVTLGTTAMIDSFSNMSIATQAILLALGIYFTAWYTARKLETLYLMALYAKNWIVAMAKWVTAMVTSFTTVGIKASILKLTLSGLSLPIVITIGIGSIIAAIQAAKLLAEAVNEATGSSDRNIKSIQSLINHAKLLKETDPEKYKKQLNMAAEMARAEAKAQAELAKSYKLDFNITKIGKAISGLLGFNSGGVVYAASGYLARGNDTISAMLSPGEMVLNRSQQSNLFDMISGRKQLQTASGPTVNINVGTMVASRGEQREFARKIKELLEEDSNRY